MTKPMTPRKRLFDMEIDEVSLVDRPANQHAGIEIAKSASSFEEEVIDAETVGDLFYGDGTAVDDTIADGDYVYDGDGDEYIYMSTPGDADEAGELGKALGAGLAGAAKAKSIAGADKVKNRYKGLGRGQKNALKIGGGATAGAGTGYALSKGDSRMTDEYIDDSQEFAPSLSQVVLEELSKAASDEDRNAIVAASVEEAEIAKAEAFAAQEAVLDMQDTQLEVAFISKAAEYNLPVDPAVLGPILKSAASVLDAEQLDVLDALFNGVGEALYDEIGYEGGGDNVSVMDMVDASVEEHIGKSDFSPEAITTAVFDSNPDAYDQYIAEKGA